MSKYTTEAIRSVALIGHGAAGKTSLAEALLQATGAIPARGSVEKGSTVCDFDLQEKEAGHSLNSAVVNFGYEGTHVHLVDTPGYPDFSGPAIAALAGVDTALVVVNAQTGIELMTERMMRYAAERKLCRMIVINKIDRENADPNRVLQQLAEHGLVPESWGGDTIVCMVSALQEIGIDELLDNILITAEVESRFGGKPSGKNVEGGGQPASRGGKSYADLPADAIP